MFVVLVVLALVASFQAFGTLLALGPMLLPAAASRCWGLGVAASMALAIVFGALASVAGLLISYHANLPSGPAIVLAAGAMFGVSLAVSGAWRRLLPLVALLVAVLLAAPCSYAADRMPVVATFSVIADMIATVGGDHIAIRTIVGPGGDSELYQPTAADVASVASARAVFLNDLNDEFEPWLEPLLRQAAFKGTKVVATRRVRTLTAEEEHPVSGRQLPTAIDQHAWLDPRNGVIYVRNIAEALARLDPANAADYRARAAAYTKEIQSLDEWARKEIAGVPPARRRLLTSHDSLQYLANAYGITIAHGERLDQQQRAICSRTGEARAADPRRSREGAVSRQHHRPTGDAAYRRRDRRDHRRHALRRYALPSGGDADTYLKMLRHDVATLKAGMLSN